MTDHPNLASALVAFQAEMPTVTKAKRAEVPTKSGGKYSYTYADLAGVTEVAMPLLTKHGLSFTSQPRRFGPSEYELAGILRHTSGEFDEGSLPIKGGSPQELGSSLTYMRRYLLGCLTGIVTEDDDDGAGATKVRARKAAEPTPDPGPQDAPARTMSRPARPADASNGLITKAQSAAMHASFNGVGMGDRDVRLDYCRKLIGRDIASSSDLTSAEASRVLEALRQDAEAPTDLLGGQS